MQSHSAYYSFYCGCSVVSDWTWFLFSLTVVSATDVLCNLRVAMVPSTPSRRWNLLVRVCFVTMSFGLHPENGCWTGKRHFTCKAWSDSLKLFFHETSLSRITATHRGLLSFFPMPLALSRSGFPRTMKTTGVFNGKSVTLSSTQLRSMAGNAINVVVAGAVRALSFATSSFWKFGQMSSRV